MSFESERSFLPAHDLEPLSPLAERVERERDERVARIERLNRRVETLFAGEASRPLREEIRSTFDVPQWGKYHNEGMYLDTHLEKILSVIDDLYAGVFPSNVPDALKILLQDVVTSTPKEQFERYTFTHDIAKKRTMKLKFTDGTQQDVSWDEWNDFLLEPLRGHPDPVQLHAFLKARDVEGISYYRTESKHGEAGVEVLNEFGVDMDPIILKAIAHHEDAFVFSGIQADVYAEQFGSLSEQERRWAIAAGYTDVMGSYQSDDRDHDPSVPLLDVIVFVMDSKLNFDTIEALRARLDTDSDIQNWKHTTRLKDTRIANDLSILLNQKTRLVSADVLFERLKDSYHPKLIERSKIKSLILVLQTFQLGSQFRTVQQALVGLNEGVSRAQTLEVLTKLPLSPSQQTELVAWFDSNLFA